MKETRIPTSPDILAETDKKIRVLKIVTGEELDILRRAAVCIGQIKVDEIAGPGSVYFGPGGATSIKLEADKHAISILATRQRQQYLKVMESNIRQEDQVRLKQKTA